MATCEQVHSNFSPQVFESARQRGYGFDVKQRSDARRALLETFVAIYDDDTSLTLETGVEEAILQLPDEQRNQAIILLREAELDHGFRLRDLFSKDPESY